MITLVVLASGEGTNFQAVLDAIDAGALQAEVVALMSQRKGSGALLRAEVADISTCYVPFKPYRDEGRSREEYDRDLADLVEPFAPDWIVCLGWVHLLSGAFLDRFPERVINLHPALPGTFPGKDAIARAWEAWHDGTIQHAGAMVHLVVPEVDAGPVLASVPVPILASDTFEAFETRMHAAEHDLVVDVLRALAMADQPAD